MIKHSPDILREGISVFADFMAVSEREAGLPQIRVHDFVTGRAHLVPFADNAYDASVSVNEEFHTEVLRLAYSSPITPNSRAPC